MKFSEKYGMDSTYTNSFAVVVGINNYSNVAPMIYAVNDAIAIAEIIESKYRFD